MEDVLDLFRNDVFSTASLYRVVDNATYVPQILTGSGIFTDVPVMGDLIHLYEEDNTVRLIPTTERGAPDTQAIRDVGRIRTLRTVRLSKKDSVRASELLNVAAVGLPQNVRLRNVAELVNERMSKLRDDMEMTMEFQLLGALKGKLIDADGTTVVTDFFAELGVTQGAIVDVNFSTLTEDAFQEFFVNNFFRPIIRSLKDRRGPGTRIGVLCGDNFWSELMKHPGFRAIWKLEMQARAIARASNPLVQPNAWLSVDYAGFTWWNYMGTDDGTTIAVETNLAYFFPINAKDVFVTYLAPGETFDQVGQGMKGKPFYPMIRPDPRAHPEFVDLLMRRYPLPACIYPKALMRAKIFGT